jgi:hypothetical protein
MKTRNAICKFCSKEFTTTKSAQKFCSKKCAYEYTLKKTKVEDGEQPCWSCTKACGGCSWSKSLKPIEGWKAEKRILQTARKYEPQIETYKILYCPEYEKEIKK